MAGGGFVRLPDGSVIVALSLPRPRAAGTRGASGTDGGQAARPGAGPGNRHPAGTAATATDAAAAGTVQWPWRWRAREHGDEAMRQTRRWSAHADTAHTVRAAAHHAEGDEPRVRVLVHAGNRARALTRLRNLGMRAIYLSGNAEPPTPDEVTAVLHHPDGLVWRATPGDDTQSWQPIAALLRPQGHLRTA